MLYSDRNQKYANLDRDILRFCSDNPPSTVGNIASCLDSYSGAISKRLEGLMDEGCVGCLKRYAVDSEFFGGTLDKMPVGLGKELMKLRYKGSQNGLSPDTIIGNIGNLSLKNQTGPGVYSEIESALCELSKSGKLHERETLKGALYYTTKEGLEELKRLEKDWGIKD